MTLHLSHIFLTEERTFITIHTFPKVSCHFESIYTPQPQAVIFHISAPEPYALRHESGSVHNVQPCESLARQPAPVYLKR